jgi:nicotinamide mononucleotide transporter
MVGINGLENKRQRTYQSQGRTTKKNNRDRIVFYYNFVVFSIYKVFDYQINVDNYIDIIASGIFFTGMWYMANKKIENWILGLLGI